MFYGVFVFEFIMLFFTQNDTFYSCLYTYLIFDLKADKTRWMLELKYKIITYFSLRPSATEVIVSQADDVVNNVYRQKYLLSIVLASICSRFNGLA